MADRPRRGAPPAAVRAPDPHRISLSGRAAFGRSSRLQSSPSPAPCSTLFPTLSHTSVTNGARRPRLPVEPPMTLPVLLPSHRPRMRMPNAILRSMVMIWPTWRSVSRWSTAARRMTVEAEGHPLTHLSPPDPARAPPSRPHPHPRPTSRCGWVWQLANTDPDAGPSPAAPPRLSRHTSQSKARSSDDRTHTPPSMAHIMYRIPYATHAPTNHVPNVHSSSRLHAL